MCFFKKLRQKKWEKQKEEWANFESSQKDEYKKMSAEKAQMLFNKEISENSQDSPLYTRVGQIFSLYLWLKYSPDAPKGLALPDSGMDSPQTQERFIFQSLLRFGFKKERNPYLNVNYDGAIQNIHPYDDVLLIWKLIDEGTLQPDGRDNWLFDKSLYNESWENNMHRIKVLISCFDEEFKDKYGLINCVDPVNQLKKDGKFMNSADMDNQLEAWQTKHH